MNPRPDQPDLPDEARLRRLLDETLADVEPGDHLEAIRTRTKGNPMSSSSSTSRPWVWGALGAAVATAAIIGGFAVLNNDQPVADQGPVGTPSATVSPTESPSPSPTESATPNDDTIAAGIYYAGDTPSGVRLYREFQRVDAADPLLAAARAATEGTPTDPDYRTLWGGRVIDEVSFDGTASDGLIQVRLSDDSALTKPPGMTDAEAQIAIEQVIYTLQAVVGARAPVQFYLGTNPVATVLGVPTSEPLAQGEPLEVLSLVSLTSPAEGDEVSGTLEVEGVASSFEATVPWEILQGTKSVATGFFTASGFMDKLHPFAGPVDLSDLAPGTYTFVARTDDPSSGEGPGPHVDTRTIIVQ